MRSPLRNSEPLLKTARGNCSDGDDDVHDDRAGTSSIIYAEPLWRGPERERGKIRGSRGNRICGNVVMKRIGPNESSTNCEVVNDCKRDAMD